MKKEGISLAEFVYRYIFTYSYSHLFMTGIFSMKGKRNLVRVTESDLLFLTAAGGICNAKAMG